MAVGLTMSLLGAGPAFAAGTSDGVLFLAPSAGAHGDEVDFTGACPRDGGVVAAVVELGPAPVSAATSLGPTFRTHVTVPVGATGTFEGSLVVAVDLPPGSGERLSVSCMREDGTWNSFARRAFTVRDGEPPGTANRVTMPSGTSTPGARLQVSGTAWLAAGRPATSGTATLLRQGRIGEELVRTWQFPVGDDGAFTAALTVPAHVRPGDHRLELIYQAGQQFFGGDQVSALRLLGPRFTDVPAGSAHGRAIVALSDQGVTIGCGDDRFCPDEPISRAQFASLFHRASELPATGAPLTFDDVVADSPHATAIAESAARGAIVGCAQVRYCPNSDLRRDQAVSIIMRVMYEGFEARGPAFADVPAGSPHAEHIHRARTIELARGCAPDRFCPRLPLTRAQAASLLARAHGWDHG